MRVTPRIRGGMNYHKQAKTQQNTLENWLKRTLAIMKKHKERICQKKTTKQNKNQIRILAANINRLPSKKMNKHKLKSINK